MSNILEEDIELDMSEEELRASEREFRVVEVMEEYERKMQLLTSQYSEAEQKTWATQLEEARAYLKDTSMAVPMLTEIADGKEISALAQSIVAKAEYLKIESGKILAWKNREIEKI